MDNAKPYKVEVIADSTNTWVGNGLRFPTIEAAKEHGADLFMRWMAVQRWRVVDERDGSEAFTTAT